MTLNINPKQLISAAIFTLWLILAFAMCSCSPEVRASKKLSRAEKLIKKAKFLDPTISMTDTIIKQVPVITERVVSDTIFHDVGDTIVLNKDRLKVIYKRDTITNEIYLSGECESDTIVTTIKIPQETLIIKQSFWETIGIKKRWFIIVLVIVISLVVVGVLKKFVPF